jgi:hypothetical protein
MSQSGLGLLEALLSSPSTNLNFSPHPIKTAKLSSPLDFSPATAHIFRSVDQSFITSELPSESAQPAQPALPAQPAEAPTASSFLRENAVVRGTEASKSRCIGHTLQGAQCSRLTADPSGFCHQHNKSRPATVSSNKPSLLSLNPEEVLQDEPEISVMDTVNRPIDSTQSSVRSTPLPRDPSHLASPHLPSQLFPSFDFLMNPEEENESEFQHAPIQLDSSAFRRHPSSTHSSSDDNINIPAINQSVESPKVDYSATYRTPYIPFSHSFVSNLLPSDEEREAMLNIIARRFVSRAFQPAPPMNLRACFMQWLFACAKVRRLTQIAESLSTVNVVSRTLQHWRRAAENRQNLKV